MTEKSIPARPALSKLVSAALRPMNTFFDWCYHSEFNPFYRSGTLAIGLLFVLLATGFYLLFFYSVSSPYESIVAIQNQVWVGRWVRALHRYATDAVLIAVFFHVLQLLAQGKTWGPRTLAWVSGVILLIALFVSAWTGYVMVWDQHGQLVAEGGTRLLREFPFLRDELGQAFSGQREIPASFFFMNLFLHVAIPLGMVFGMWIHTARLARTVWFPIRSVFYGCLGSLIVLSIVMPAVLLPKADLLQVVGEIEADWFFSFWIPLIDATSPTTILTAWAVFFILGLTTPWWWKPARKEQAATSIVNDETCNGCTQCSRDCPYEAIRMVPHPNGKHLLAEVTEAYCVSCGICTASCDVLAVGPPGRDGIDQIARVNQFCEAELTGDAAKHVVLVGCNHNDRMTEFAEQYISAEHDVHYFPMNCAGTLHSTTLETLLENCGGVVLAGCAARNCTNRDGLTLLSGRLFGKRVPFLAKDIDRRRILVAPHSDSERTELAQTVDELRTFIKTEKTPPKKGLLHPTRLKWFAKRTVATVALVGGVGALSQAPMGEDPADGIARVIARLPSRTETSCRPLTDAERSTLPTHMQRKEICEERPIRYRLSLSVDGTEKLSKTILPKGLRGEIPIFVNEEIPVSVGTHTVAVSLIPSEPLSLKDVRLEYEAEHSVSAGKIELISLGKLESATSR